MGITGEKITSGSAMAPRPQRLLQGIQDQRGLHRGSGPPAQDAPGVCVDHERDSVESGLSGLPALGLPDVDDWQQGCGSRRRELPGRGAGRGGDVGEPAEQGVEGGLPVVDGGALVVGEREDASMRCRLSLASSSWALPEPRGVEVASCAGHPVWALLEEGVGAVAVAEVVVLPGLPVCAAPERRRRGRAGPRWCGRCERSTRRRCRPWSACSGDLRVVLGGGGTCAPARLAARTGSWVPWRCKAGWRSWSGPGGW